MPERVNHRTEMEGLAMAAEEDASNLGGGGSSFEARQAEDVGGEDDGVPFRWLLVCQ